MRAAVRIENKLDGKRTALNNGAWIGPDNPYVLLVIPDSAVSVLISKNLMGDLDSRSSSGLSNSFKIRVAPGSIS